MTTTLPEVLPSLPFGADCSETSTVFSLFSKQATSVLLCLFGDTGTELDRFKCEHDGAGRWSTALPDIKPGQQYGFRVEGPYDPAAGLRFNPAKLLIDPYALAISGNIDWNGPVFGYASSPFDAEDAEQRDSASAAPKSVVVDRGFDWQAMVKPCRPLSESIIYELHVKGSTITNQAVPADLRGTYAGLSSPAMLEHFQRIGITAVELMPPQAFLDDEFLVRQGLKNYWGYNPIGFLAPEGRYSHLGDRGGQVASFKTMVRQLHAAGIEVIVDIVMNHTAEGDERGATLSWRGVDNAAYYRARPGEPGRSEDFTGCGNTVNAADPGTLALILDALRYWAGDLQVDGFRFDLATTIGRYPDLFIADSPFFAAVAADPLLGPCKMIAEPWDLGPEGYQLGNYPPGWSEWNDRYRDTVRSFWLGYPCTLGEFSARLSGSADIYQRSERPPQASVNYVTAHDGFTLQDLVSYTTKLNTGNGQGGHDGSDHNHSQNFGIEGDTDDPGVWQQRQQARRNLFATLMLSIGTPMMLGGDELNRTQQGNNNAYCQDNEMSWWNWQVSEEQTAFLNFVSGVIQFRRNSGLLRSTRFFAPEDAPDATLPSATWYSPVSGPINDHDWRRDGPRTLVVVIEPSDEDKASGAADSPVLLIINGDQQEWHFRAAGLELNPPGFWRAEIDTSSPTGETAALMEVGQLIPVPGNSLIAATWVNRE